MNTQILDTIKDALGDITKLTPEKLQGLVQETVAAFQGIQAKISSKNEGDREEGLRSAIALKTAMEEQVQKLQKKLDMTPEQIEEYIANPLNFSKEEYKSLTESKKDLEHIRGQLQAPTKAEAPIQKKKHKNKNLILA